MGLFPPFFFGILSSPDAAAAAAVNAWPSYSSSSSFNADNFDSSLAILSSSLSQQ
jgi:hypothetical protein